METNQNNPAQANRQAWFGIFAACAVVSGALSAVACGVMAWNYPVVHATKPLESPELDAMKTQLAQPMAPAAKETLRGQARELDLKLRRQYFGGVATVDRGRFVLMAALAALAVSLALAAACRKKLPMPRRDSPGEAERLGKLARWSVGSVGTAMLAAAVALLIWGAGDLTSASSAGGLGLTASTQIASTGPAAAGPAASRESNPTVGKSTSRGASAYTDAEYLKAWPRFRGPDGSGVSAYTNVADSWDGPSGKNILWRSAEKMLPGENSAVVWGKKVFLTGADKKLRLVYCFDAETGNCLWKAPVSTPESTAKPLLEIMEDTGFAAPTACTDGQRVFALFANMDVGAVDFDGKVVWTKNVGPYTSAYGYGTSLCSWKNLLYVVVDQGTTAELGKSKIFALDAATGKTVWQALRPDVPASWSTPIVIPGPVRAQLITCSNPFMIAYDAAGGKENWRAEIFGGDMAPSPVFAGGMILAAMEGYKLYSVKPDGKGDVTKTAVAWAAEENLPELCSPVGDGNFVWLLKETGIVTCYDAKTGKKLYDHDFDNANFKASPSVVGDKVYIVCEDGKTIIVKAGAKYQELGTSSLGEHCNSSPAFQDGRIYLRGKKTLFCIGKK